MFISVFEIVRARTHERDARERERLVDMCVKERKLNMDSEELR